MRKTQLPQSDNMSSRCTRAHRSQINTPKNSSRATWGERNYQTSSCGDFRSRMNLTARPIPKVMSVGGARTSESTEQHPHPSWCCRRVTLQLTTSPSMLIITTRQAVRARPHPAYCVWSAAPTAPPTSCPIPVCLRLNPPG